MTTDTEALPPLPQKLAKELVRLADILRDCGRLISTSGDAERIMREAAAALTAAPQAAQAAQAQQPTCTCGVGPHRAYCPMFADAAQAQPQEPKQ